MKKGSYFKPFDNNHIQCQLCPHQCILPNGEKGKCKVRSNLNGTLNAENYGILSSISLDPVEKKPLYHFYPGAKVLSIGSLGCNLDCFFCQNCDISQASVPGFPWLKDYSPDEIVQMAAGHDSNIGIAFTYNEPTISYEYILEIARLANGLGMKTAMVSNGYINREPLVRLLPFMDAFNIDLKAFRDDFYKVQTGASLSPVLETLKILNEAGKHIEITNLIIPGLNDDPAVFSEMIDWISAELGMYTVLHLSRYFPHHKLTIGPTPVDTLKELYALAKIKLPYVYLGNVASHEGQQTRCTDCGELLIDRSGYHTEIRGIAPDRKCKKCGSPVQNIIL